MSFLEVSPFSGGSLSSSCYVSSAQGWAKIREPGGEARLKFGQARYFVQIAVSSTSATFAYL